jgi:hypothetical protein
MGTTVKGLPAGATPEQIDSFVDNLLKTQAESDKKAEEKKIQGGEKETPVSGETPADEKAVSTAESAAVEEDSGGEEESGGQEWLTDDLKAEAAAMGIEEAELSDFAGREELDRAMRVLHRGFVKEGRKAFKEDEDEEEDEDAKEREAEEEEKPVQRKRSVERSRGSDGKFKPSREKAEEASEEEPGYKVSLSADEYDEEVVKEFEALRDYYASQIKALGERFSRLERAEEDRELAAHQSRFDALVDGLGHGDLFGETDKESEAQLENRRRLYDAQKYLLAGLHAHGVRASLDKTLLNRVLRMEFSEQLSKKDRQSFTRKISRQSEKRMGGAGPKPTDQRRTVMEEMEELYERLERESREK